MPRPEPFWAAITGIQEVRHLSVAERGVRGQACEATPGSPAVEPWQAALVLAVALGASLLSFFSGFGLGTLLLPAFALVAPLDVAVAATAVVHLANNLAKGGLVGRHADRAVVLRFGVPALLAAFAGAWLLLHLGTAALWTYGLGGERRVTPLGLVVGGLVTAFAAFELVPALRTLSAPRHWLSAGGLLSGFFGGLSGHQGALRSVFLTRLGLAPAAFVATGTLCAVLVDLARVAVYASAYRDGLAGLDRGGLLLLGGCVLLAVAAAVAGARLLPKATVSGVRLTVGALLLALGPALALGLV